MSRKLTMLANKENLFNETQKKGYKEGIESDITIR